MPKTFINNYSGLGSVFTDGLLGALLSTGVFATLLPNLVEMFGQVVNLGSFKALNVFSVVYFLGPLIVCTAYWLLTGHIQYIYGKINPGDDSILISNFHNAQDSDESSRTRLMIFTILITKISVILLYLWAVISDIDLIHYTTSLLVLGVAYPLVFFKLQLYILKRQGAEVFSQLRANLRGVSDQDLEHLRQSHFRLSAWILIPDLFIGLALIVFSHPWIVYHNGFFPLLNFVAYGLAGVMATLVLKEIQDENLRNQCIYFFFVILLFGAIFPSVNMNGNFRVISIFVTATVALYLLNNKKLFISPVKTGHVFFFVLACLLICFGVYPVYERNNRAYLEKRFDASQQLSNKQLFPFADHQLQTVDLTPGSSEKLSALAIHKENMKVDNAYCSDSHWDMVAEKNNVRKFYYYNYESIADTLKKKNAELEDLMENSLFHQHAIDSFYAGVSDHLSKVVFNTLDNDKTRSAQNKKPSLRNYNHPLDYYASFFAVQKDQLEQTEELTNKSAAVYHRTILLDRAARVKENTTLRKNFNSEIDKLRAEMEACYSVIPELKGKYVTVPQDSAALKRQVSFHMAFLAYKKALYNDYFGRAQKIYRSYLVDSQRVGIFLLCCTLVIVVGIIYLNGAGEKYFRVSAVGEEEKSSDRHNSTWYILGFGIFILILPLLRPIEPEMINPENPYWMISLEQWHAPTFARATLEEESTRYDEPPSILVRPSGTLPNTNTSDNKRSDSYYTMGDINFEEPGNNVKADTALRIAIDSVKAQLGRNKASTDAIDSTLKKMHETMERSGLLPRKK